MNYIIREAVISDAEAIRKLNCDEMGYIFLQGKTEEKIKKLLETETDKIYVAVSDGEVIGYVHANNYDTLYAPHMKNIMGIAVRSEHKRCGIGRALLYQVELWAAETGAAGVRLVSGAARTEAHAFYHSCGYGSDRQQLNLRKMLTEE